jgi:flagellar hook assembly protein FlgD
VSHASAQTTVAASSDTTCTNYANFQLKATPSLFTTTTDISFLLPSTGTITLKIYDFIGRLVRTLVNEDLRLGNYHFTWNGRSDSGEALPSGIYTCVAYGFGKNDYVKIDLLR